MTSETDCYTRLNICNERSGGSLHWQSAVFLFVSIMDISFLMRKVSLTARKELLEKNKQAMEEWLKAMLYYRNYVREELRRHSWRAACFSAALLTIGDVVQMQLCMTHPHLDLGIRGGQWAAFTREGNFWEGTHLVLWPQKRNLFSVREIYFCWFLFFN